MAIFGYGPPPASGGATIFGEPAWEWNQADTSQFAGSASFSLGAVTPTLEVSANANVNQAATNELRLSATGTGTASVGYFIDEELPFEGENRDMMIEYVMGQSSTSYVGFCILADDTGSAHSYNILPGITAGWQSQVDAGTVTVPGSTKTKVLDTDDAAWGRIWVRATKPSGGAPRFHAHLETQPGNGTQQFSARLDYRDQFPNEPPAASWNSLECKKVGLVIQASGGGALGDFRMTEMRVFLL